MSGIVWLASYPKSGNTWVRVFLTNFLRDGEAPADIHELEDGPIASARAMFDEAMGVAASDLTPVQVERYRPQVYEQIAAESRETLYLKIHDAFRRTPEGVPLVTAKATAGVLYLVRNPLDVAVSFGFHRGVPPGEMVSRLNDPGFIFASNTHCLPNQLPQRLLTWSGHVQSWLDGSGLPVHVVRYEDLLLSPVETFTKLLAFVGLDPKPRRVRKAIDFSGFDVLAGQESDHGFRERPTACRRFFRKGCIGDWRNHLTEAQAQQIVADHGPTMKRLGYLSDSGEIVF
jgi:aryl sulfotransferase